MFHGKSKSFILRKTEEGVQKLQSTRADSAFFLKTLIQSSEKLIMKTRIMIITHLCVNSERNTSTTNSDNKVLPLQDLLTFFDDISVSIWRIALLLGLGFGLGLGLFQGWRVIFLGTIVLKPYQPIRRKNSLVTEVCIYIHALLK